MTKIYKQVAAAVCHAVASCNFTDVYINGANTAVIAAPKGGAVRLYNTRVVEWTKRPQTLDVVINDGGYCTATTADRVNAALDGLDAGVMVRRRGGSLVLVGTPREGVRVSIV